MPGTGTTDLTVRKMLTDKGANHAIETWKVNVRSFNSLRSTTVPRPRRVYIYTGFVWAGERERGCWRCRKYLSLPAAFLSSMLVRGLNTSVASAGAKTLKERSEHTPRGRSGVGGRVTSINILLDCVPQAEAPGQG